MRGIGEKACGRCLFDDLPGVHHGNPVSPPGDDAEIMGNEQHGHATARPQPVEHLQDLRLHRHVERRSGLVGNQDLRFG
jgi:hypothetical protein